MCPIVLEKVKAIVWSSLQSNIHLGILLDLLGEREKGVVHACLFQA